MNRKFIIATIAFALISGTALAQRNRADIPNLSYESFKKHHFKPGQKLGEMHVDGNTYIVIAPPQNNDFRTREDEGAKVPVTPIITEAPGSPSYYIKDVDVAYVNMAPYQGLFGLATALNWDGNDIYFPDPVTVAEPIGNYVKATKTINKIVMPMNQTLLTFEGDDLDEGEEPYALNYGLLRPVFTKGDDGKIYIWYQYSGDYNSVTYTMDKNNGFSLQYPPAKYDYGEFEGVPDKDNPYLTVPPYALGYYYNNDLTWTGWSGYCEWSQNFTPFQYEAADVPSGLQWNYMSYINNRGIGVIVYVAETDDAVYFKGLSAYLPDAVFKADKLENGNISVAPGQFLGIEDGFFFVITNTGCYEDDTVAPAPEGTNAIFIVERDSQGNIVSISADPNSDYFLVFDDDPGYFYEMDVFAGIVMEAKESFAATPSTPYDLEFNDKWIEGMGSFFIFFKLSPFSDKGEIIDTSKLYYTVFINDEPYEFEEQVGIGLNGKEKVIYSGMKTPSTLVPYSLNNGLDLYEDTGGTFIVGLYSEGIETVGVESVYIWDNQPTYSNLVTIDITTNEVTTSPGSDAKVEAIDMDKVCNVEYFDLQGRKVSTPGKGIYVKKYIFNDNTFRTVKVIRER